MDKTTIFFYFTAVISVLPKSGSRQISKKGLYTNITHVTEGGNDEGEAFPHLPISRILKDTFYVLMDRDNLFDINNEDCVIQITYSTPITEKEFTVLRESTFGKGGVYTSEA